MSPGSADIAVRLQNALHHVASQFERVTETCLRENTSASRAQVLTLLEKLSGYCQFADAPDVVLCCDEIALLLNPHCSPPDQVERRQQLLGRAVLRLTEVCGRIDRQGMNAGMDATFMNELRVVNGAEVLPAAIDSRTGEASACTEPREVLACLLTTVTNASALANTVCSLQKPAILESGSELRAVLTVIDAILKMVDVPAELVPDGTLSSDSLQAVARALAALEIRLTCAERFNDFSFDRMLSPLVQGQDPVAALASATLTDIFQSKVRALSASNFDEEFISDPRAVVALHRDILLQNQSIILVLNNFSCCPEDVNAVSEFLAVDRHLRSVTAWWEIIARNSGNESCSDALRQRAVNNVVLLLVRIEAMLEQRSRVRHAYRRSHESVAVCRQGTAKDIDRSCVDFANELKRTMSADLALDEVTEAIHESADNENAVLFASISLCLETWKLQSGIHYVSQACCTALYKLSANLLLINRPMLSQAVTSLYEIFTTAFESQGRADNNLCAMLECLLEISSSVECLPEGNEEPQRQKLRALDEAICHAAAAQAAVEAPTTLPAYLARSIRELLTASTSLQQCLQPEDFHSLSRRLVLELRMLAAGARTLRVYRIERLSTVLAEVHHHLAGSVTDSTPVELLAAAHECLRSGLNQAAARQEVGSPREIIAGLYRWLEDNCGSQGGQESLPDLPLSPPMEFRREAEELMTRLEVNAAVLLRGESSADSQDESRTSLLQDLHTLKGNAGFFECERIATLCHCCEASLLDESSSTRSLAVAERARTPGYSAGHGVYGISLNPTQCFEKVFRELRTAMDALTSSAPPGHELSALPVVPVTAGSADNSSITIPAQDLRRIAELASLVHTLNLSVSDVLRSLRAGTDSAELALLADLVEEQGRYTAQLEEEIDGSKTISFARVTPRLLRLAGRYGNQLDKQVQLSINNDDLRMDRALVERLVAPLEHLLRNAIDHGIESVPVRRARGKPDAGCITLSLARTDDGIVTIELRDDGNGIDPATLLARATSLGTEHAESVAPQARLRWLLEPGFSTRTEISEQGGHGIGLAAVNKSITALRGNLQIQSEPGRGSCFRLQIPV